MRTKKNIGVFFSMDPKETKSDPDLKMADLIIVAKYLYLIDRFETHAKVFCFILVAFMFLSIIRYMFLYFGKFTSTSFSHGITLMSVICTYL